MFEERSRSQTLFALSPRKLINFRHPRKNSDDCLGQRAETHRGPERHETPLRGEQVSEGAREYARLKGKGERQMANITRYY